MRTIKKIQMKFGQVRIEHIHFDPRSRDEIPQLLRGLQYIFCTPHLREKVFNLLEKVVPEGVDKENGRPGMELWKILVLGTLRLNCNWDYDKLQEIANHHDTLRKMLGHAGWEDETYYPLQTLKDNVSLLTPKVLNEINRVVVEAAHDLVKKKEIELKVRCDSFVVETNVHYPTDITLLYDAMRKVITLLGRICDEAGVPGFRKKHYLVRKIKRGCRHVRNHVKAARGKKEEKARVYEAEKRKAYRGYLKDAQGILDRSEEMVVAMRSEGILGDAPHQAVLRFMAHARRQIDQIYRRAILGEAIPQNEKVFSVFEDHTEWISKGKAGVPQELGLKVAVMEDQYRFILHHRVMEREEDVDVLLPMLGEMKRWYPNVVSCSVDKGFYSPDNKKKAKKLVSLLVMPKKGKLSRSEQAEENAEAFRRERHKRSAVESAIHALENHGLDRCPDHGMEGFQRYVSLAVLARNLQIVGSILLKRELRQLQRKQKRSNKIVA